VKNIIPLVPGSYIINIDCFSLKVKINLIIFKKLLDKLAICPTKYYLTIVHKIINLFLIILEIK